MIRILKKFDVRARKHVLLLIVAASLAWLPHVFAQAPDPGTVLNNQAIDLADNQQFDQALVAIDQSLQLDPKNEVRLANKAQILLQARRVQEALDVTDGALRDQPHSSSLREIRMRCLEESGLFAEGYRQELELLAEGYLKPDASLLKYLNFRDITPEAMAPHGKEIRLDGFFQSYAAAADRLDFDVYLFALPNGKFNTMQAKRKTVPLHGLEPEYVGVGSVPVGQLRRGDFITVVGQERGGPFVPRRIMTAAKTEQEEKKRGALFNAQTLPWIEDQDYPELPEAPSGQATFLLKGGAKLKAAAASVIRDGNRTALITMAGAFQPEGGDEMSSQSALERSNALARQFALTTRVDGLKDEEQPHHLSVSLPVHFTSGVPFAGGEILAASVKNASAALNLARESPKRGDVVFLQEWDSSYVTKSEGTVEFVDSKRLFLRVGPRGESERVAGSVIVNRRGEVVGLDAHGDEPYISGVSLPMIRQAMAALPH